jgi:hypothetical protein
MESGIKDYKRNEKEVEKASRHETKHDSLPSSAMIFSQYRMPAGWFLVMHAFTIQTRIVTCRMVASWSRSLAEAV